MLPTIPQWGVLLLTFCCTAGAENTTNGCLSTDSLILVSPFIYEKQKIVCVSIWVALELLENERISSQKMNVERSA